MAQVIADRLEILGCNGMQAYPRDAMLAMVQPGAPRPERQIDERIGLGGSVEAPMRMDTLGAIGATLVARFRGGAASARCRLPAYLASPPQGLHDTRRRGM